MRTNLSCIAFSSFSHSGRKGATIYRYVKETSPRKSVQVKEKVLEFVMIPHSQEFILQA